MKHFDKATEEWFLKNPFAETTVMQCDKCGLCYKPSLGHECKSKEVCDLTNKCGSCEYAVPTTFGKSHCYVECANREHVDKYCKSPISLKRQRTHPACRCYAERKEDGNADR